jgi:hypothetical protein
MMLENFHIGIWVHVVSEPMREEAISRRFFCSFCRDWRAVAGKKKILFAGTIDHLLTKNLHLKIISASV